MIAIVACVAFPGRAASADDLMFGHIKADKILFLGNSITLCGPYNDWIAYWGMAASAQSKDYVHLLTDRIRTTAGGALGDLPIAPPDSMPGRWYDGDPLPNYGGNIINIADIFERNYDTWDNARIQNQLDALPDLVILQFGENMEGGTMEQFSTALNTLLDGLKAESNPHIFVTSHIIGSNPVVDQIKRDACAADPEYRVFVPMTGIDLSGVAGHPNDAGMQTIADTLYGAMEAHATPEPGSLVLLTMAGVFCGACAWRRCRGG